MVQWNNVKTDFDVANATRMRMRYIDNNCNVCGSSLKLYSYRYGTIAPCTACKVWAIVQVSEIVLAGSKFITSSSLAFEDIFHVKAKSQPFGVRLREYDRLKKRISTEVYAFWREFIKYKREKMNMPVDRKGHFGTVEEFELCEDLESIEITTWCCGGDNYWSFPTWLVSNPTREAFERWDTGRSSDAVRVVKT